MRYRQLGRTGISVSELAFGAGPVSGLMTSASANLQADTVRRAVELGINWIDTAAGYGQGRSESNLGRALGEQGLAQCVHVATKVRLAAEDLADIDAAVRGSFAESLRRLGLPRVTLLQLHNSITVQRGDEPTSITTEDVLGPAGVLAAFRGLRASGLVEHFGLTGIGDPESLREVIRGGEFTTIQLPYHVLNPSASRAMGSAFAETNYGNLMADSAAAGVAVLAIRVFAAGALLDAEPSPHTLKTPFFPLDLYERDRARRRDLAEKLRGRMSLKELALRFVLGDERVATAIIGFGSARQVEEANEIASLGPLPEEILAELG